MGKQYSEIVQCIETKVTTKKHFNWLALFVWIVSLIISLIPIYISALKYLAEHEVLDVDYWFKCITKDDILWVFATFLLFSLFNSIISLITTGRKNTMKFHAFLYIVASLIFVITEATWIVMKYFYTTTAKWPIYLGLVLIICCMIISTPLEINFIKQGE